MSNVTATQTAKVVINACYGGFSLSDDAIREYLRRTGREWTEEQSEFSLLGTLFHVIGDEDWYDRDLDRADPVLVAIVEEMGEAANGSCANLEIRELPKGTLYRIDEYDGYESIQTRDGIDWRIA